MKPDWLRCEKCLWWEDSSDNPERCHHSTFRPSLDGRGIQDYTVGGAWYCENWTCANCWGHWQSEVSAFKDNNEVAYVGYRKLETFSDIERRRQKVDKLLERYK